ncbi:hypothetical protein AB835_10800 [Candidatus Endobugula sertula]|uniref:Uncharacterized protein n=1 Tax=Candidatus Endobugula sertula TaxID=62101 RepID=A0A1D2QNF8_9GAMM|nr:hypothetical protein AB835_10800 [Candidatus Endobugula sertula]
MAKLINIYTISDGEDSVAKNSVVYQPEMLHPLFHQRLLKSLFISLSPNPQARVAIKLLRRLISAMLSPTVSILMWTFAILYHIRTITVLRIWMFQQVKHI